MTPLVVVHGGVDTVGTSAVVAALRAAADQAWECLGDGQQPTEAAAAAVAHLEDDELFNAGYGSVLNREGCVELDAAVLAADTQRFAGVLAVQGVKNPVLLANRLQQSEQGPALLAGSGAAQFARSQDMAFANHVTDDQALALQGAGAPVSVLTGHSSPQGPPAGMGDTVGAIVAAPDGLLAVATSSGGLLGKWPGRVGDAVVPGAGLAGEGHCAALCSGVGETSIRSLPSQRAVAACRNGASPAAAAQEALDAALALGAGPLGVLAVNAATGDVAVAASVEHFPVVVSQARGNHRTVSVACPANVS